MKRGRGRPKLHKDPNLEETLRGEGKSYIKSRSGVIKKYTSSITEVVRSKLPAEVIFDFWMMILNGQTPLVEAYKDGYRVIPDPNPLHASPTLEQRTRAVQQLSDRGWGQTVQSLQLDASFKAQLDAGLPEHMLEKSNMRLLADIANMMKSYRESDVVDAELVEPLQLSGQVDPVAVEGLQEPCQVETPEKSTSDELQELGQDSVDINENSDLP